MLLSISWRTSMLNQRHWRETHNIHVKHKTTDSYAKAVLRVVMMSLTSPSNSKVSLLWLSEIWIRTSPEREESMTRFIVITLCITWKTIKWHHAISYNLLLLFTSMYSLTNDLNRNGGLWRHLLGTHSRLQDTLSISHTNTHKRTHIRPYWCDGHFPLKAEVGSSSAGITFCCCFQRCKSYKRRKSRKLLPFHHCPADQQQKRQLMVKIWSDLVRKDIC